MQLHPAAPAGSAKLRVWPHYWPAFALGIVAVLTQTVLLREAMSAAAGHELMFGVVLTGWLAGQVLCLLATWRLAGRLGQVWAFLLAGALVPLSLYALRFALLRLTPADGTLPPLLSIAPAALLCTLPAALGLALAFSAVYHHTRARCGQPTLRGVYAAETLGFLVGGAAWAFLLAGRVDQAPLLLVPLAVTLGLLVTTRGWRRAWTSRGAVLVLAIVMVGLQALGPWGYEPPLPSGLETVRYGTGRLAQWQVASYGGDYGFYRDGRLVSVTGQPDVAAERILLPLAQALPDHLVPAIEARPPLEILHIGIRWPGVDTLVNQARGIRCTWLESDELYTQIYRDFAADEPAQVVQAAPAAWVGGHRYDCVILSLGPPGSPATEWAYSREFFRLCRDGLSETGVLALSLDAEQNYNSPAMVAMHEEVLTRLREVFPSVVVAPPSPVWYFASAQGAGMTLDPMAIEARLAAAGVANPYMSRWVLADRLAPERAAAWQVLPNGDTGPPSTLSLAGLRLELLADDPQLASALDWLNANRVWLGVLVASLVLILPFALAMPVGIRPAARRAATTAYLVGFTCLATEVVLAWRLQAVTGQLYWLVALLSGLTLGGLFLGTGLSGLHWSRRLPAELLLAGLLILGIALALPASLASVSVSALWLLVVLVPLGCGLLLGRIMAGQAARPAVIYAADLIGAALAALLVGTLGMLIWRATWSLVPLAAGWLTMALAAPISRAGIIGR